MDDIWPKGLPDARVGSLVKRNLFADEFGKLFIPDRIGIITAIECVGDKMMYDVLFFIGVDGEQGQLHTLRLYDEDLMLVAV